MRHVLSELVGFPKDNFKKIPLIIKNETVTQNNK